MPNKNRCKWCREYFPAEGMIKVPAGTFCTFPHVTLWLAEKNRKEAEKKHKQQKRQHRADKAEFKANDRSAQLRLTQGVFNKMRVLEELLWFQDRGIVPSCISCGKPLGGDQWCCGHFKTRGSHPELRFDRSNSFLQHNNRCNMNLSGDIEGTKQTRGYRDGLTIRFGLERGNEIIEYCESKHNPKKYTCEELISMRKGFNAEIRTLNERLKRDD